MTVGFAISGGGVLSRSHIPIFTSTDMHCLEGDVIVSDGLGRRLETTLSRSSGLWTVHFNFTQSLGSSCMNQCTVDVLYNVSHTVCELDSGGPKRFYFPWIHKWSVPVRKSTYRIQFPD